MNKLYCPNCDKDLEEFNYKIICDKCGSFIKKTSVIGSPINEKLKGGNYKVSDGKHTVIIECNEERAKGERGISDSAHLCKKCVIELMTNNDPVFEHYNLSN